MIGLIFIERQEHLSSFLRFFRPVHPFVTTSVFASRIKTSLQSLSWSALYRDIRWDINLSCIFSTAKIESLYEYNLEGEVWL